MAIIRCPYCHAIIDENDKYCNNCGTQLLFPEDEAVEEEIPGEKILEAEDGEEDKDYELHEPGQRPAHESEGGGDEEVGRTGEIVTGPVPGGEDEKTRQLAEDDEPGEGKGAGDEDEDDEEEAPKDAELEGDEDETEEVVLVEEPGPAPPAASSAQGQTAGPAVTGKPAPEEETRVYPVPKAGPMDETVELPVPPAAADKAEVPPPSPAAEPAPAAPAGPAGEDSARPAVPPTFDTRELEGIGRTVDLSKQRLDKMIEVMAEKQKERAPEEPAPSPERTTGTLPPWADKIKGAGAAVERENTRDTGQRFDKASLAGPDEAEPAPEPSGTPAGEESQDKEEVEIFPRRRPSSGIGLPERLAQADLPFGPAAEGPAEEESAEDLEAEEEEGGAMEAAAFERAVAPPEAVRPRAEEPRPVPRPEAPPGATFGDEAEAGEEVVRPPFNFSTFFKAKAFDVLFVGVFWLVALWVAARSMEATLFELLSVTSNPVLLLYAAFLGLYLFLFKFFLGETLGDRLFKDREERG